MAGPGFAVIDFETTGLFPDAHRVIEVAVVHVDPDGTITGQWDTLVNPNRDLGPQHIHRIQSADVMDAPSFAGIAPQLIELLSGRILVAHNATLDKSFLIAELGRLGYGPPVTASLCTMQLAREFIPGAGRSLKDCCDAYGIQLENAHRASVDALATAQLLGAYILDSPMWSGWVQSEAPSVWKSIADTNAGWKPRSSNVLGPRTFIERITLKLPEYSGPAEHLDYLALLDRCLLDKQLSAHEANSLVELAEALGISRTTCEALHVEYFDQLTAIAWADGLLSSSEIDELTAVGATLGISTDLLEAAMQPREVITAPTVAFALMAGDLIVLTGDMVRSREDWHQELEQKGFVPWSGVTKKVRLVAAADPDSLSGKARKARDYGIPIVGERGLAALMEAHNV